MFDGFRLLVGIIIALMLHELTHYLALLYYKVGIKAVIVTWWTAVGFLVANKGFLEDNVKISIVYLFPLLWSLLIFLNPSDMFLWAFPIVSLAGGAGDLYFFLKLTRMPSRLRIDWAEKIDESILRTAIWRRDLRK